MGTLRSSQDWSGREVVGAVLGEAARATPDPPSGDYLWDHPSLPDGMIDSNGDVWVEVDDAQA